MFCFVPLPDSAHVQNSDAILLSRPAGCWAGMGRKVTGAGRPRGSAGPGERQKRGRDQDMGDEYDNDFVDSDGEGGGDWRSALRSVTKYDPSK